MNVQIGNVVVTTEDVEALVAAMDQLLDDMGMAGQSVCLAAKAQARVALQPFLEKNDTAEWLMPLDMAQRILEECDG